MIATEQIAKLTIAVFNWPKMAITPLKAINNNAKTIEGENAGDVTTAISDASVSSTLRKFIIGLPLILAYKNYVSTD